MWDISASIYGDSHRLRVDLDDLEAQARRVQDVGNRLAALGNAWSCTLIQLESVNTRAVLCASRYADVASVMNSPNVRHSTMNVRSLISTCSIQAQLNHDLAERCSQLAQLLRRARGVYSDAEYQTLAIIGRATQSVFSASPIGAFMGTLICSGASLTSGALAEGSFNANYAISGTSWAHEGLVAALSQRLAQVPSFPILEGLVRSDESNQAASRLTPIAQAVALGIQGGTLTVTRVVPQAFTSYGVDNVTAALRHLDQLGDTGSSGLPQSTLSIHRYTSSSGERRWLVTIPGTQADRHSPLGWAQNVQLMSTSDSQRMQAASARFVLSAMEQAGIQAGERVALVGHSQGGIVAAAIASHENLAYRIDHIVTAGSPIANHPIPNSTWVTSVEIEDEVVSALDGAPNQQRDAWITVRGKVSKSQENSDASKYLSTLVSGSGTAKLLPHGMNYHRAAWQSVMDLGSVDAQEHDEHFSETISGELEESMFFHGQMTP
jgi:pimeloyl-ACP methyl ester carboxylesterase